MMKNLNRIERTIILLFLGVFLTFTHVLGQSAASDLSQESFLKFLQNEYKSSSLTLKSGSLKATENTLDSIEDSYCQNADKVHLVVNEREDGVTYVWSVFYPSPSFPNTDYYEEVDGEYYFLPDQVSDDQLGLPIGIIGYEVVGGKYTNPIIDYTYVYAVPTSFNVTVEDAEICYGDSTKVKLSDTETYDNVTVVYELLDSKNNVLDTIHGTGEPISFVVQPTSTTTYHINAYSENDYDSPCDVEMSGDVTVTVNDLPSTSISGSTKVCYGSEATYSTADAMSGGYTWSVTGGTITTGNASSTEIGVTWTESGTITVVYSDGSCSNTSTLDVSVIDAPSTTISGDATACYNTEVTYTTESVMSSYNWTITGGTITTGSATSSSVGVTWTSTGTISVEYSDGTCSNTATKSVTVYSLPTITVSGDSEVCLDGAGVTYTTESGMSNYDWTVDGGTISSGSGTDEITVIWTSAGNHTVYVNYENSNGCSASTDASLPVVVNALPTVTLSGDSEVCLNTTGVTYTTQSGMSNYSWSVVGGTITAGAGTYQITVTWNTVGQDTVSVSYEDTNSCSPSVPVDLVVTVNDLPTVLISYDTPICSGSDLTLNTTASGGSGTFSTYTWTYGGSTISGATGSSYTVSAIESSDSGTYGVSVTDSNGCISDETTSAVTVYESPSVTINNISDLCSGDDLTLETTATVGSGSIASNGYTWSFEGTTLSGETSNTYSKSSVTTADEGNYKVIVEDSYGCSVADSIDVTVNSVTAVLNITNPSTGGSAICSGNDITFNASASDGSGTYTYEFFIDDVSQGSASTTTNYSTTVNNDFTFSVVVYDGTTGCSDTASMDVTSLPLPSVSLISPSSGDFCAGEGFTLRASPSGYSSYTFYSWNGVSATELYSGSSEIYTLSGGLTTDVTALYVVAENDYGCSSQSSSVSISVKANPQASITVSPDPSIAGAELTFTASDENGDGTSYDFYLNSDYSGVINSDNSVNTFTDNSFADSDVVSVVVANSNGCTDTASVSVTVYDALFSYDVIASDTTYCSGESGVSIYLNGTPQVGVTYRLEDSDGNQFGSEITYTGSNTVKWTGVTGSTDGTAYYVYAYYNVDGLTDQTVEMNNTVTIYENELPSTDFTMTPTGTVEGCNGGEGYEITLDGSEIGVKYILYRNGVQVASKTGDGNAISFGYQTVFATYTIYAVNVTTLCSAIFDDSFTIADDGSNVDFNLYVVNSEDLTDTSDTIGDYCAGEDGVELALDGSLETVYYLLYRYDSSTDETVYTGITVEGTGEAISFGTVSDEGTYTVHIESSTGCEYQMSTSVVVSEIALPASYTLTVDNDGYYCEGGDGVSISLSNQEDGVTYYLYNDGNVVDSYTAENSGSSFKFNGPFTAEGLYYVKAFNSSDCSSDMLDSVEITINPAPTVFDVTSDGDYCEGSYTTIYLSDSETDVLYTLVRGTNTTVDTITGTGGQLYFEVGIAGTYTITAQRKDEVTGCESVMNGTITINENALPDSTLAIDVTHQGTGCDDGSVISITNSELNVTYTLVKIADGDSTITNYTVTGNNGTVSFDPIINTDAIYTALATSTLGCTAYLLDTAYVNIDGVLATQTLMSDTTICADASGVEFKLADSEDGISYSLYYIGSSADELIQTITSVGGGVITFDAVSEEGEYYVIGTSSVTGCSYEMDNHVTLTINALPTAKLSVSPSTSIISGTEVTFSAEDIGEKGATYAFYINELSGTAAQAASSTLEFVTSSLSDGDIVIVEVTDAIGCTNTDSITMTVYEGIETVTVKQTPEEGYCYGEDGVSVYLDGTPQEGVTYKLVRTSDDTQIGDTITYTGSNSVEWNNVVGSTSGVEYRVDAYYVDVPDDITVMGTVTVYEHALPVAYITVNDDPTMEGTELTFTAGDNNGDAAYYDFYLNDDYTNSLQSSDSESSYVSDNLSDGDKIIVVITNSNGCTDTASVVVAIYPTINQLTLAAEETEYCYGDDGVTLYLEGTPQDSVTYELIQIDPDTEAESVFGSSITYDSTNPVTIQWDNVTGTYQYVAKGYYENGPDSIFVMNDTITVTINALPTVYNLDPNSTFVGCTTQDITLDGSELGVNYILYINDNPVDTISGTGSTIVFEDQNTYGTYTIVAYNVSTGCSVDMNGSFTMTYDGTLEAYELYVSNALTSTVTDGSYCEGGDGADIKLSGSSTDSTIEYILYRGNTPLDTLNGTGNVLEFGYYTEAGYYTVNVITSEECTLPMTNTVVISIIDAPVAYTISVDNGGEYCENGSGVDITLDGQEDGVSYYLYLDNETVVDTIIGTVSGNVSQTFANGPFLEEGTYSVTAVNDAYGCTSEMSNTIDVSIISNPDSVTIVSDGYYCEGSNTTITIEDSEIGVDYWFDNGSDVTETKSGTGAEINFTISEEGDYVLYAKRITDYVSCEAAISDAINIVENALPSSDVALGVIDGDDTSCAGDTIYILNPEVGVQYVLVNYPDLDAVSGVDTISTEMEVDTLKFSQSIIDSEGVYTVEAINEYGCSAFATSTVTIENTIAISKQKLLEDASICNGDAGYSFSMEDSEANIIYSLYLASSNDVDSDTFIESVTSEGGTFTFSPVMDEGTYYVVATDPDGIKCSTEMQNRVTLTVYPLPVAYSLIGSGAYCEGSEGAEIKLDGSEINTTYYLQFVSENGGNKSTVLDTTITIVTDTISLGYYTGSGTYTVVAVSENGCSSSMNGSVTPEYHSDAPDSIEVIHDDLAYCESEGGVSFNLDDSQAGVTYSFVEVSTSGNEVLKEVVSEADGEEINFGTYTVGSYMVSASWGGDACTIYLQDSEGEDTFDVTSTSDAEKKNVLPEEDITVCGSDTVSITLEDPDANVDYELQYSELSSGIDYTVDEDGNYVWKVSGSEFGTGYEIFEVVAYPGTECESSMGTVLVIFVAGASDFEIVTDPLVSDSILNDTIRYCAGDDGIYVGVVDTEAEIYYWLVDTSNTEDPLSILYGTSTDADTVYFDYYCKEGEYTVIAKSGTGCENYSTDTLIIEESPLPSDSIIEFYCVDGSIDIDSVNTYDQYEECVQGNQLCLEDTKEGIIYYLYNDSELLNCIDTIVGNESIQCFDVIDETNTYYIQAVSVDYPNCEYTLDTIDFDYKSYGTLVAVSDTIYLGQKENSDTLNLRSNDILRYFNDNGDAVAINYSNVQFSDTSKVIDKYLGDIASVIDVSDTVTDTNIRFKLLSQDYYFSDISSDSTLIENEYTGKYSLNKYTGVLTYVRQVDFYGYDKIQYQIYNTEIAGRDSIATVYIVAGNEDLTDDKTFIIPNAFSPNGDGINDTYIITINDNSLETSTSSLEVFNRWGTLVYRSKGSVYGGSDEDDWWDGTSNQATMVSIGKDLPNGTYFYVFKVKLINSDDDTTTTKKYSGFIELRR